jgi:hypothetical protein
VHSRISKVGLSSTGNDAEYQANHDDPSKSTHLQQLSRWLIHKERQVKRQVEGLDKITTRDANGWLAQAGFSV